MSRRPTYRHQIRRGQICPWPEDGPSPADVAENVSYMGSTLHKTYKSVFGPPAYRSDKAKCAAYPQESWPKILIALQAGIKAKCVGEFRGDFPARVWVWVNSVLHEARITNQETGEYHGFPIDDPVQYPVPETDLKEKAPHVEIPQD